MILLRGIGPVQNSSMEYCFDTCCTLYLFVFCIYVSWLQVSISSIPLTTRWTSLGSWWLCMKRNRSMCAALLRRLSYSQSKLYIDWSARILSLEQLVSGASDLIPNAFLNMCAVFICLLPWSWSLMAWCQTGLFTLSRGRLLAGGWTVLFPYEGLWWLALFFFVLTSLNEYQKQMVHLRC